MTKSAVSLLFILSLTMACGVKIVAAATPEPTSGLLGYWRTEDSDAVIQFYPCGESYCGRFVWLKDDSAANPSLDDKNPDPERRKRPLCGLTFLGGFVEEGNNRYGEGWVYSARHGSMFSASLHLLSPDKLELRGYVFLPLLGGSQTWTRIEKPTLCELLDR